MIKPTWGWLIHNPPCFLAFGFGFGLAPIAPGTFGTLPALPIAALWLYCGFPIWSLIPLALLLFFPGIRLCSIAEQRLGVPDYGGIVWDEIVAMLLILGIVPAKWQWWLAAFILFRLFDAIKPFPIKQIDRNIHGGFGIMLDDLLAALMVMIILYAAQHF